MYKVIQSKFRKLSNVRKIVSTFVYGESSRSMNIPETLQESYVKDMKQMTNIDDIILTEKDVEKILSSYYLNLVPARNMREYIKAQNGNEDFQKALQSYIKSQNDNEDVQIKTKRLKHKIKDIFVKKNEPVTLSNFKEIRKSNPIEHPILGTTQEWIEYFTFLFERAPIYEEYRHPLYFATWTRTFFPAVFDSEIAKRDISLKKKVIYEWINLSYNFKVEAFRNFYSTFYEDQYFYKDYFEVRFGMEAMKELMLELNIAKRHLVFLQRHITKFDSHFEIFKEDNNFDEKQISEKARMYIKNNEDKIWIKIFLSNMTTVEQNFNMYNKTA